MLNHSLLRISYSVLRAKFFSLLVMTLIISSNPVLGASKSDEKTFGPHIIGFYIKEDYQKKYSKVLAEYQSKQVIVGEYVSGIVLKDNKRMLSPPFIIMPMGKTPGKADKEIRIPLEHISPIKKDVYYFMVSENQTLNGIKKEYDQRLSFIEAKEDKLKELEKELKSISSDVKKIIKSDEQSDLEQLQNDQAELEEFIELSKVSMVKLYEDLSQWLDKNYYFKESEKLQKKTKNLARKVEENSSYKRKEEALSSIGESNLREGFSQNEFKSFSSKHVKITFLSQYKDDSQFTINETTAINLLKLAENAIDHMRANFSDLYYQEDPLENHPRIQDGLFQEFVFVPDNDKEFIEYFTKFTGQNPGNNFLKAPGQGTIEGHVFISYWRMSGGIDLESIVANTLGRTLGEIMFNDFISRGSPQKMLLPFASIGLGQYLSYELLGRNTVQSLEFVKKEGSRSDKVDKNDDLDFKSLDSARAQLFLHAINGQTIDKLLLSRVNEFQQSAEDTIKAWAFIDWLLKDDPEKGLLWLKEIHSEQVKSGKEDSGRSWANVPICQKITKEIYEMINVSSSPLKGLDALWKEDIEKAIGGLSE